MADGMTMPANRPGGLGGVWGRRGQFDSRNLCNYTLWPSNDRNERYTKVDLDKRVKQFAQGPIVNKAWSEIIGYLRVEQPHLHK